MGVGMSMLVGLIFVMTEIAILNSDVNLEGMMESYMTSVVPINMLMMFIFLIYLLRYTINMWRGNINA